MRPRRLVLFLFPFTLFLSPLLRAGDIADQFPEVAQVAVDYPDDADQYAALQVLHQSLRDLNPDVQTPLSLARDASYTQAFGLIESKYQQIGATSPAYAGFWKEVRKDESDPTFTKAVTRKYQIPHGKPVWSTATVLTTPRLQPWAELLGYLGLIPLAITFILMRVLIRTLVARSGLHRVADRSNAFVLLPAELRVIHVPDGVAYPVEIASGLVLDRASGTRAGGGVETSSSQVYSNPVPSKTDVGDVRVDTYGMRTPDDHEVAWTFSNSPLEAREGHLLSSTILPGGGPNVNTLLVYNHTTGQIVEDTHGLDGTHFAGRNTAWWLATAIGTVGFGIGFGILLGTAAIDPDQADAIHFAIRLLVTFLEGAIAAAVISLIMCVNAQHDTVRRRTEFFRREYSPKFEQFLRDSTPSLLRRFSELPPAARPKP